MIGCLLSWLILVCVLALIFFLVKWVLAQIVAVPEVIYHIFGIILGLVAIIQLLGCLGFVENVFNWPRVIR